MSIKRTIALSLALGLTLGGSGAASAQQATDGVLVRNDGIYLRCDQCGTVQSVERNITQGRDHGTMGAILGAVAGGVLGNQVGRGNGRKIATVGGAVGGGFAGNAIGKGGGSDVYVVRLRMGNGSYNNVQVKDASGVRQGDLVQLDPNGNITRLR